MIPRYSYENARQLLGRIEVVESAFFGKDMSEEENYSKLLSLQCELLTQLCRNDLLSEAYTYCFDHEDRESMIEDIFVLLSDFGRFLDYINIEKEILQSAGVSARFSEAIASKQMVYRSINMLGELESIEEFHNSFPTAQEFQATLSALQAEICNAHSKVDIYADHMRKMREAEKKELGWLSYIVTVGNSAAMGAGLKFMGLSLLYAYKSANDANKIK